MHAWGIPVPQYYFAADGMEQPRWLLAGIAVDLRGAGLGEAFNRDTQLIDCLLGPPENSLGRKLSHAHFEERA